MSERYFPAHSSLPVEQVRVTPNVTQAEVLLNELKDAAKARAFMLEQQARIKKAADDYDRRQRGGSELKRSDVASFPSLNRRGGR